MKQKKTEGKLTSWTIAGVRVFISLSALTSIQTRTRIARDVLAVAILTGVTLLARTSEIKYTQNKYAYKQSCLVKKIKRNYMQFL